MKGIDIMANKDFNKAEALRRYKAGEKVTAIAEAMGVTKTDVYSAIRELKRAEEWNGIEKTIPHADGDSGADNTVTSPEGEAPSDGVSAADTGVGKPVPKKRGRKKKAEESKPDIEDIRADVREDVSDDKSDSEDIGDYCDSAEEWAERKCAENKPAKDYLVKLKDGSELIIEGVAEIFDCWNSIKFKGRSGKAVIVSAAELMYYHIWYDLDALGHISVD